MNLSVAAVAEGGVAMIEPVAATLSVFTNTTKVVSKPIISVDNDALLVQPTNKLIMNPGIMDFSGEEDLNFGADSDSDTSMFFDCDPANYKLAQSLLCELAGTDNDNEKVSLLDLDSFEGAVESFQETDHDPHQPLKVSEPCEKESDLPCAPQKSKFWFTFPIRPPTIYSLVSLLVLFLILFFMITTWTRSQSGLLIGSKCIFNGFRFIWMHVLGSRWLQSGPCSWHCFCYPASWLILSCVMLNKPFLALLGLSHTDVTMEKCLHNLGFKSSSCHRQHSNNKINHGCLTNISFTSQRPSHTIKDRLQNLAMVSALSILNTLPVINDTNTLALRSALRHHRNHMGFVQPSLLHNMPIIDALRVHLNQVVDPAFEALKGAFQFVVDTGCTTTATPFKEDFEKLVKLEHPVTLHGIAGDQEVTHGGVVKFDCVNSLGDIVTIRTFGYYNPHQNIRLFSPQAFFYHLPKKKGAFTISWSNCYLHLEKNKKEMDIISCQIDKYTFLPI